MNTSGKYLLLAKYHDLELVSSDDFISRGTSLVGRTEGISVFDPVSLKEVSLINWCNGEDPICKRPEFKGYKLIDLLINEKTMLGVLKKNDSKDDETIALFERELDGKLVSSPVEVHKVMGVNLGGGVTRTVVMRQERTGNIVLLNETEGTEGSIKVKYKLLSPSFEVLDVGDFELPFIWDKFNQYGQTSYKWMDDNYLTLSKPVKQEIQGTGRRPKEVFFHLINVFSFSDRIGRNFILKSDDRRYFSVQVKADDGAISVWGSYSMNDENGENKELHGLFKTKLDVRTGDYYDTSHIPFSQEFYASFKNERAGQTLKHAEAPELSHYVTGLDIIEIIESGEEQILVCTIQNNLVQESLNKYMIYSLNRHIVSIVINKYNELDRYYAVDRIARYDGAHSYRDVHVTPMSEGRHLIVFPSNAVKTEYDKLDRPELKEEEVAEAEIEYAIMQRNGDLTSGKITLNTPETPSSERLIRSNRFIKHNDQLYIMGKYGDGKKRRIFALGRFVEKE
jgi:hypothetical protein